MMGTNYYLTEKPPCKCCGRDYDDLHIGKSSGGWCFSLHIIPDQGIHTLDDWRKRWKKDGVTIRNEYRDIVSSDQMEDIITNRGSKNPQDDFDYEGNYATQGPNGLVRYKIGPYCNGHGDGTWDYIPGDFS